MHALLERAHTEAVLASALRTALGRADSEAVVRLGAEHGCFVSRDDAAVFGEVATFVTAAGSEELTPEELETVAGGGAI
jgi:predicted ribosomally synthesized peptide with nif11-like leader